MTIKSLKKLSQIKHKIRMKVDTKTFQPEKYWSKFIKYSKSKIELK